MAWIKVRVTDDGDKRFVGCYRDPEGRQRSAGTFSSRRAAERAANREEGKVREGAWHDHTRGQVTFAEYVETVWLPSKQVETSTLAAYRSYLDKHFIPVFGRRPIGNILPSEIQRWVTTATTGGLSAASVRKYHTMLHSIFERALTDRVITFNPCEHTELPKGHCCVEPSCDGGTADLPVGCLVTCPEGAIRPSQSAHRDALQEVRCRRAARFAAGRSRDRSMQQCRCG